MVHTGRQSHCTPFPQQKPFGLHQAETLCSIKMKPEELGSRSRVFPSRPGHQARAQAHAGIGRAGSRHTACPSSFLYPWAILWRKVRDLLKCRRGSVYRKKRGKTKVGWVWVARVIQHDPQSMEGLNLWCWNVNMNCLMLTCHKYVLNSQFQQISGDYISFWKLQIRKTARADVNTEANRSKLNMWAMHEEMLSSNKTWTTFVYEAE